MISISTLIYRSAAFADATWQSLHENTPHLHDGRARFFFVANDPTQELVDHLRMRRYPFVVQRNKQIPMERLKGMGYWLPEHINRVYLGFNRIIQESDEQLVILNSDMMYSPGWLEALEGHWNPNRIVAAKLVERSHPKFGVFPGAIHGEFGNHPQNFKKQEFLNFADQVRGVGVAPGTAYAPVMMSRSKALEAGLYPHGNHLLDTGPVYGDQVFFAKMRELGVEHVDALDSIVYHFKEGEREDTVASNVHGITIVVPCEANRLDLFRTTYATYMAQGMPEGLPWEFILVSRTIDRIDLPGVRVVNYEHRGDYFNPAKALNLGVAASRYDTIFVTSPEVKPITDVVGQWTKLPAANYICRAYDQSENGSLSDLVRTGLKDHIPSMYFLGIFRKEDILKINGWDEEFMAGFSWEDVDFGERFSRAGLTFTVRDDLKVLHMFHPRNYDTPGWNINWSVLEKNIAAQAIRCRNGIVKE